MTGLQSVCLTFISLFLGCVHWSWNVCIEGKEGARNSGRFWDGCGQSNEEGDWEEHVIAEAVEVNTANQLFHLYSLLNCKTQFSFLYPKEKGQGVLSLQFGQIFSCWKHILSAVMPQIFLTSNLFIHAISTSEIWFDCCCVILLLKHMGVQIIYYINDLINLYFMLKCFTPNLW